MQPPIYSCPPSTSLANKCPNQISYILLSPFHLSCTTMSPSPIPRCTVVPLPCGLPYLACHLHPTTNNLLSLQLSPSLLLLQHSTTLSYPFSFVLRIPSWPLLPSPSWLTRDSPNKQDNHMHDHPSIPLSFFHLHHLFPLLVLPSLSASFYLSLPSHLISQLLIT